MPLAIPFFIWIGVFSLMIVAQFWSFANVIYDKSEGERLFAIVGFGASLGAVFGARIADRLIEPIGIYQLLLLGAAVLGSQVLLTNYVDRRERAAPGRAQDRRRRRRRRRPRSTRRRSRWCSRRATCCSWPSC